MPNSKGGGDWFGFFYKEGGGRQTMYMSNFTKFMVIHGKIFDEILKSDYVQIKKEHEDAFIENAK